MVRLEFLELEDYDKDMVTLLLKDDVSMRITREKTVFYRYVQSSDLTEYHILIDSITDLSSFLGMFKIFDYLNNVCCYIYSSEVDKNIILCEHDKYLKKSKS